MDGRNLATHKEKYSEWFHRDVDSFVLETKRDWYGLDFIFVRDNPGSLFWRTFLNCQYDSSYLDFMPIEAVQQRIAYIQEFYQRTDEVVHARYQREYIYLPKSRMDQFVEDAVETLMQTYERLQNDVPEGDTILEFLNGN